MKLLDLFFPKRCVGCGKLGNYLCQECLNEIEYLKVQTCSECYHPALFGKTHPGCQKKFGLDGVVSLVNYKSPIKEIVKELKYRLTTDLLTELEAKLEFPTLSLPSQDWPLLPLPLHRERQNFRGFNQAELLARLFAEKLGLNLQTKLLGRVLPTKSQVGLSKSWREKNVKGAFVLNGSLKGGNYFIFDDVWTSGSSLKEATKVLKKAGARQVWGLTLAHPH